MWRCADTSTCSSLPSSVNRGRPLPEPCGCPPSSVLWIRNTARLPVPAPAVALGHRFISMQGSRERSRGFHRLYIHPNSPNERDFGYRRFSRGMVTANVGNGGRTRSQMTSRPEAQGSGGLAAGSPVVAADGPVDKLDGRAFARVLRAGALAVVGRQEALNRINVFPYATPTPALIWRPRSGRRRPS